MNVILYIRVSTAEQAQEGYSIGEQTERLTAFAAAITVCKLADELVCEPFELLEDED